MSIIEIITVETLNSELSFNIAKLFVDFIL